MTKLLFIPIAMLLLAGCTGAPHVDQEFGKATRQTFEAQIAFPDSPYADQIPEGVAGLTAEEIMEVYTNDFGKATTEANVFELGVKQEDD